MSGTLFALRDALVPADLASIERLWLEYLTWGNDELEARRGFRLPVRETVDHDLASIEQFQPPDGRILLACSGEHAFGIGCLRRIQPHTAEIKRMYVQPSHRRAGAGGAILDALIAAAGRAGYSSIRLDSPDFMTAAHALYRTRLFEEIAAYPESEIPESLRSNWLFMERAVG